MTGAGILNPSAAAAGWKMESEQPRSEPRLEPRRSVIETKSSQPAFPGQPPPLQVIFGFPSFDHLYWDISWFPYLWVFIIYNLHLHPLVECFTPPPGPNIRFGGGGGIQL